MRYLNQNNIDEFQKNGFIVIKDLFKPWINELVKGFEKVLKDPGPHSRENIQNDERGRFFEDYCNWHRIPEFVNFINKSPAAQIVGEATNSKSIQIFHDHIFIKETGTDKITPWHQDMPYYCVNGDCTGSFWIPLDQVTKENSLKLIKGSHKWPKLLRPTKWSNDSSWYKNEADFMEMPNLDFYKENIVTPEVNLGDAILFNFKVVHGAPGNKTKNKRRAFSMRFVGDDVRYQDRGGETSPPFKDINLKTGDYLRKDWFPVVWSR